MYNKGKDKEEVYAQNHGNRLWRCQNGCSDLCNPDFNASLIFGLKDPNKPSARFYDFGIMTGSHRFIRFDQTNGIPESGVDVGGLTEKKTLPPQGTPLDSHLELDDEGKPLPDDGGEGGEGGESVIDPDYKVEFGSHIEDKVREKVIEAATQCEKMRGKLPAGVQQIVENFRNGKLHWKELLRASMMALAPR